MHAAGPRSRASGLGRGRAEPSLTRSWSPDSVWRPAPQRWIDSVQPRPTAGAGQPLRAEEHRPMRPYKALRAEDQLALWAGGGGRVHACPGTLPAGEEDWEPELRPWEGACGCRKSDFRGSGMFLQSEPLSFFPCKLGARGGLGISCTLRSPRAFTSPSNFSRNPSPVCHLSGGEKGARMQGHCAENSVVQARPDLPSPRLLYCLGDKAQGKPG